MSIRLTRMLLASAAVAAVGLAAPAYAQVADPLPPPTTDDSTVPPPPPPVTESTVDSTVPPPPPATTPPTDAIVTTAVTDPTLDAVIDTTISGLEHATNPLYGDINPFYGTINPFYGTINPFYGDINPFYGDINPFYGDIGAFWGDIGAFYGDINPFYGDINPFYGDINPFNDNAPALSKIADYWQGFGNTWENTQSLWTNPLLGSQLTTKMNAVIADAKAAWGASIQAQTGRTFEQAFLNPLFAKYGINPNLPLTMQALSTDRRNQFFLDWYDGLMRYSGTDRVDHWMRTVNWTPAITQQQGSGSDSIIGLLDATVTGDPDISDNVAWSGGYSNTVNGHGIGVASLMVAAHDRQGIMGIAPNATVIAYNPFDFTGTASWTAIRTGVLSLASRGASVINMSLGVPGYALHPDWRKIFFDPAVVDATRTRVFVLAAGNDGLAQTQSLAWNWSNDPNLIIVGSTRVDGTISSFSNTPGNACLLDGSGNCREMLMNRFIVAPGELILLPDGQGGFVRRNGTSFAAPLVSGAITLLHDRWPWLAHYPHETVDIILRSARDLGAPGVDPVYGHGMLDVAASQSPLDYNHLYFYESHNGVITQRFVSDLRATGVPTTWETDGVFFYLYEPIGSTFRDFAIPMSSRLTGKVRTIGGYEYFQRFAQRGLTDFIHGTSGFTDVASRDMLVTPRLRVSVSGSRPEAYLTGENGTGAPHTALRFSDANSGLGLMTGYGYGAMALNAQPGLALSTDHGRDGGVNPLLALASGGAFASVDLPLARHTNVSFGVTQDNRRNDLYPFQSDVERDAYRGIAPYQADAMNIRISHQAGPNLLLSGAYARIREHNALLGVQSRDPSDLSHGATSETATVSASLNVRGGFTFAASGTLGRTRTAGNVEQGLATEGQGVLSTAFALSATREGLLGHHDALRLSVAQPLHIEDGQIGYRSVTVVDRQTGELGISDQSFAAAGDRRTLISELLYETPIFGGLGELGLFGRAEFRPQGNLDVNQYAVGSRVSFNF